MADLVYDYIVKNRNKLEKLQQNVVDFVRERVPKASRLGSYSEIELIPTANRQQLSEYELHNFSKELYSIFYQYIKDLSKSSTDARIRNATELFRSNENLRPQKLSGKQCYDLFFENNVFREQSKRYLHFNPPKEFGFIYAYPFTAYKKEDITRRLYLTIEYKSAPKVAIELLKRGVRDKEYIHLKFNPANDRNDTMLVYTGEQGLPKMMKYLDEIHAEHPEYFTPFGKQPFTLPLRNVVGLADEPVYKDNTSFNNELSHALDDCIQDLRGQLISGILSIDPKALKTVIFNSFKNEIQDMVSKNIESCKKSTDMYSGVTLAYVKNLQAELDGAKLDKNHPLNRELNDMADKYIEDLKDGNMDTFKMTRKSYLGPYFSENEENFDKINYQNKYKTNMEDFKKNGYRERSFFIGQDAMFDLIKHYNLNDILEKGITYSKIAPYLEKYHLAPECPSLTTETVEKYKREGHFIPETVLYHPSLNSGSPNTAQNTNNKR